MGQDTQQLKQEIAYAREDLGTTMEAFENRVSPNQIIQRRKTKMRQAVSRVSDRVMGPAHDLTDKAKDVGENVHGMGDMAKIQSKSSPLVAGAVAAGLGFLASQAFPSTKSERKAAAQLQEQAQPIVDELKESGQDLVSNVKQKGTESAQELGESAASHAQDIKSAAHEKIEDVKS